VRGFSLVELILGLAVMLISLLVFFSVFSSSSQHSVQSRNRTVATMLANTMMDEIAAHPYGSPRPKSWTAAVDRPVQAWVEGNPQEMDFHKKIEFQNGSFVGDAAGDTDLATVTISWREGVGVPQAGVVNPQDNKVLKVQMPVWR